MEELKIPKHIAFIMDGNGRLAKNKHLPRSVGHREGVTSMRRVVEACYEKGVQVVSFYAFSTENWSRPKEEIKTLFSMLEKFAKSEIPKYAKRNFIIRCMGNLSELPDNVRIALESNMKLCDGNDGMVVNLGINYGGRDEIVYAVKKLIDKGLEVNKQNISSNLYTADIPDPDLMVRSSGEVRLSNFMLWQLSYSEMLFLDTLWPDFDGKTVDEIIKQYNKRDRRFGRV